MSLKIQILVVVAALALWATGLFVAAHFVVKYW